MPGPVLKLNVPDDTHKIQPIPPATGSYPYHKELKDEMVIPNKDKMVFHLVGDTGSVRLPSFQGHVAREMRRQIDEGKEDEKPRFLFHLGDVVYNYGAADQYYDQFFEPFSIYPAPIFAIPGNHDAAIDPFADPAPATLAAYLQVFCNKQKTALPIAGDSGRTSMTEPNTYWVLNSELATIIGLYTNVNKFGYVDERQRAWLVEQLKHAGAQPEKAIILCMHHSAYSGDANHGSSKVMIEMLEDCFNRAGVRPDIVLSGHVHNYQRYIKTYADGGELPFIVAGAGGYAELHPMAHGGDPSFTGDSPLFRGIELQSYCDAGHGFLKLSVVRNGGQLLLEGHYYQAQLDEVGQSYVTERDSFRIALQRSGS